MSRLQAKVERLRGTAAWLVSKLPLKTQAVLWEATVEEVDQALLRDMGDLLRQDRGQSKRRRQSNG